LGEDSSSDLTVGGTIFVRSQNLEPKLSLKRLFLKFEGGNPTGTQKDRIARIIVKRAVKLGCRDIAVGTCGNFGASIAYFSGKMGLKPHIFIPSRYHTRTTEVIQRDNGVIHKVDGSYEDAVSVCSEVAEAHGWYNASPNTKEVSELSISAYAKISEEICSSLGFAPDAVSVPVGNGTTLSGIHQGFKLLLRKGYIDKLPILIASSTLGGNPIIKSFKECSHVIKDLKQEDIKETEINEPLVSWHAFDGQKALDALYETNGYATYASDTKMKEYARLLLWEEGLSVQPASAASLVAFSKYVREVHSPETYVAILTGRRPYYLKGHTYA